MNTNQGSPMPRSITSHIVNPVNDTLSISVIDEPGHGGASHLYRIEWDNEKWGERFGFPPESAHNVMEIGFQNGPIAEAGVNGVTHEALLAILIDRLEGFQRGPFANDYNRNALHNLRAAMQDLHTRTTDRMSRGVEGTHQK